VGSARRVFEVRTAELQAALQRWTGGQLVDLHVSDLLNNQLPSHFDYTSWYDLLVFRRLAAGAGSQACSSTTEHGTLASARKALDAIDTSPVGFAVFDRVLLTVHPTDCAVRDFFAQRLAGMATGQDQRGAARLPSSPADLMLRMVNHMVDSYLDLRRLLTRQLGTCSRNCWTRAAASTTGRCCWTRATRCTCWRTPARTSAARCRNGSTRWTNGRDEADAGKRRERELLRVRSRDVLEHVERVLSHVRRLEQSAETAVQMHFSALGHRTNDIMRTLTVLTAIFLPLNLITGFFGMNFDSLPLIHSSTGIWVAMWCSGASVIFRNAPLERCSAALAACCQGPCLVQTPLPIWAMAHHPLRE
jgi:magnesium transporter